ncbi:GDSL esterase/lipase EXL3-like [Morus notabilis]|uniref:GDSL esterase/lipase EXL3-like n=1 Tax=Morus notabilis TaxID=981085 RepID=UPI000CED18D4|nr:GDSL esterase/lipase EXL3-like [Morus notabilis]
MQYCFCFNYYYSCILLLLLICTAGAATKLQRNESILAIQAFGDSFLDTGNNNHLISITKCNFPPYGKDFPGRKPTGRFCNGKVISDLIAEALGVKELLPSYHDKNLRSKDLQTGLCFASGGSGYDSLSSKINQVIPQSDQLQFFKEYKAKLKEDVGKERSETIIANSLFLISSGTNDILFRYFGTKLRQLQYDVPTYTDLLATWASNFFRDLYNIGARKIAVLNTSPVGCLPFSRTIGGGSERECAKDYNQAVELFNAKLSSQLASLSRELPQSTMIYVDLYNPLLHIILEPNKYGFGISDKGCCGTGAIETAILCNKLTSTTCSNASAYVFWDSIHPTEEGFKSLVSKLVPQLFE